MNKKGVTRYCVACAYEGVISEKSERIERLVALLTKIYESTPDGELKNEIRDTVNA